MNKHTNLWNEIKMSKPRTDWVSTLVTIVFIIGLAFCVYGVMMVLGAAVVIN